MRCRGPPPTGGEQRVRKAVLVSWIQVGGDGCRPGKHGRPRKEDRSAGGAELEELSSVHNYSLSDLVFSEIRENKGFRHRDKHRQRRQSISWIDCCTMSLMCLRIFLGSSCGNPKLSRRDADDPLEVKTEMALIREAGAVRDLREAELAVCSQEELRSFNAPRDHILVGG